MTSSVNEPLVSGISDQDLLDMAEHSKNIVDKAQSENEKIKNEYLELQKTVITAYGLTRLIDSFYEQEIDADIELYTLISTLRSFLSESVESFIKN